MVVMSRRESSNSDFQLEFPKKLRLKSDNDRGVEGAKLPS